MFFFVVVCFLSITHDEPKCVDWFFSGHHIGTLPHNMPSAVASAVAVPSQAHDRAGHHDFLPLGSARSGSVRAIGRVRLHRGISNARPPPGLHATPLSGLLSDTVDVHRSGLHDDDLQAVEDGQAGKRS